MQNYELLNHSNMIIIYIDLLRLAAASLQQINQSLLL